MGQRDHDDRRAPSRSGLRPGPWAQRSPPSRWARLPRRTARGCRRGRGRTARYVAAALMTAVGRAPRSSLPGRRAAGRWKAAEGHRSVGRTAASAGAAVPRCRGAGAHTGAGHRTPSSPVAVPADLLSALPDGPRCVRRRVRQAARITWKSPSGSADDRDGGRRCRTRAPRPVPAVTSCAFHRRVPGGPHDRRVSVARRRRAG